MHLLVGQGEGASAVLLDCCASLYPLLLHPPQYTWLTFISAPKLPPSPPPPPPQAAVTWRPSTSSRSRAVPCASHTWMRGTSWIRRSEWARFVVVVGGGRCPARIVPLMVGQDSDWLGDEEERGPGWPCGRGECRQDSTGGRGLGRRRAVKTVTWETHNPVIRLLFLRRGASFGSRRASASCRLCSALTRCLLLRSPSALRTRASWWPTQPWTRTRSRSTGRACVWTAWPRCGGWMGGGRNKGCCTHGCPLPSLQVRLGHPPIPTHTL